VSTESHRAWRKELYDRGLCWRCKKEDRKPRLQDRAICADCAATMSVSMKVKNDRRDVEAKDAGLCMDCPADNKRKAVASWRCREHADAALERRRAARRKNSGRHMFLGEMLTVQEIAEAVGVPLQELAARINLRKIPAEKAVAMCLQKATRS
jgi:hypothetical protein